LDKEKVIENHDYFYIFLKKKHKIMQVYYFVALNKLIEVSID